MDGRWFAGLSIRQDQFGHPKGALRCRTQDGTRVLLHSGEAEWDAWDEASASWVAAPSLRMDAGANHTHDEL